jgi:hypothetical protein
MIYKLWDKSFFRYCKKCEAFYIPQHYEAKEYIAGPVEEVERCEECCPVCPNCGRLFERVTGIRKAEFKGTLTKSGELELDNNPGEDDILEIRCAECGGMLDIDRYVKEII